MKFSFSARHNSAFNGSVSQTFFERLSEKNCANSVHAGLLTCDIRCMSMQQRPSNALIMLRAISALNRPRPTIRHFCSKVTTTVEEEQIAALRRVQELIKTKNRDENYYSLSNDHESAIKSLADPKTGKLSPFWAETVSNNPRILKHGAKRLRKLRNSLAELGSQGENAANLISSLPIDQLDNVVKVSLAGQLNAWKNWCEKSGLPWNEILEFIPEILLLDAVSWAERKSDLRSRFSAEEVKILISNSPQILLMDWREVEEKMDFFRDEMHKSGKEVATENGLNFDFDELKVRFRFLDKSGIYRHPPKKSYGLEGGGKPGLDLILIDDPAEFLKATSGDAFALEEFNAFKTLSYLEQIEAEAEEEEDVFIDNEQRYEDKDEISRFRNEWKIK